MGKLLNLLMIFFLLASCGEQDKKDEDITSLDVQEFFSIVYETVGVRALGSSDNFLASSGVREMKFNTTTVLDDPENVPINIEGNFTFFYTQFRNPVSSRLITQGGYLGRFVVIDSQVGVSEEEIIDQDDDDEYGVLDPYQSGSEPLDPDDEVEGFTTIVFDIFINDRSCSNSNDCTFFNTLQDDQTIRMIRFPNGEVIMDEFATGFQYLMKPKIRQ